MMTTTSPEPVDLHAVDGRVARAHRALQEARAQLGTEEGREQARELAPLEGVRDVTGQTLFRALASLELAPVEEAHRDALLRWVHELLQSRIAWDLTVDEADAEHAVDPTMQARAAKDREPAVAKSFAEALRALVEAPHVAAAQLALDRLAELASPVAAVRKELRARRFEAARRLDLAHPWALAIAGETRGAPEPLPVVAEPALALPSSRPAGPGPRGGDAGRLESLARSILDTTAPLATEVQKRAARQAGVSVGPACVVYDAFAREAREGWPARLGARWLEDVFRAVAPRPPQSVRVPPALGAASFLRAAARWGAALRHEGVARSLPFALRRDPYPTDAFAFGATFAVAIADRVFARRKLGLSARAADAHARSLARVLLYELRFEAATVISGMHESGGDLDELTAGVFGAPLPPPLAAAWSYGGFSGASRVDAPARLLGAVRGRALFDELVQRFDEDWFDNPRAEAHLAARAAGPVWSGEVPDEGEVVAIARTFERWLG